MHSFIDTIVSAALMLSSLSIAAPAVTSVTPAFSSAPVTILAPQRASSHLTTSVERRASSSDRIILAPVRASKFSAASVNGRASVPASTLQLLTPQTNVTLRYASINVTDQMSAWVNATMKYPSILLEDIDSVSKVDCSATSVAITFDNKVDYEESFSIWPSSNFMLFTSHLGDCDTDNERGLYEVSSVSYDNKTMTVTAASTRAAFSTATEDMAIQYTKPSTSATSKREVTQTFFGDFPGSLNLNDDPLKKSLSVSVNNPSLGGNFDVSGHLHYSWTKLKLTKAYVDVDLGVSAAANVKVSAGASYDNDVYSFSPASVTVSAFSIPGILDVGPALAFSLGVEVAASGTIEISADLTATISNGFAHIDFLDSKNTITSGWKPVYTHAVNISAEIEAQVNPFMELTAEIAVSFLGGLLDLSSGVKARPQLINVFSLDAQFNIDNNANVTIPASKESTCINGVWFSSAFAFIVSAFVTQFYSLELYRLDVPIYQSGCWSWAPEIMNGTSS